MDKPILIALVGVMGTLGGTVIGALTAIVVAWINKKYEDRRALRELAVRTGMENWKNMFEVAKLQGGGCWIPPLDDFIVHMLLVSEKLLNQKLTPDEIKTTVANIRTIMREIRAECAASTRDLPKQS